MSKARVMMLRLHGGGDEFEYALTGEGSGDNDCPPKRRQVVDAATHQHQHEQQEHQEGDSGDDDDKLLARDLAALSVSEREEAMLNLHGIYESDQQVQETPELLQTSIAQLDNCLEKFMSENNGNLATADIDTSAYRKALIQNPEYVKDPGLRTCILRTEKFQVEEAAKRLFRFFNAKELIFGETLLTKNICLQDLSEDDRLTLQSGFLQFLPLRDSSGRALLLVIPALRGSSPVQSRVKIAVYMILSLMEDIETHRRGLVLVHMNIGDRGGTNSQEATTVMQKFSLLGGSLPIRADAYHVCFDESAKKAYSTICTTKCWSRMRVRARLHMGNLEKLKVELMSFGICCNPEIFPILTENDVDLSHHRHWLQGQCQKDGYDIAEFFKQIESETVSMDSENTEGINTTDTQMDDSSEEMIERKYINCCAYL